MERSGMRTNKSTAKVEGEVSLRSRLNIMYKEYKYDKKKIERRLRELGLISGSILETIPDENSTNTF